MNDVNFETRRGRMWVQRAADHNGMYLLCVGHVLDDEHGGEVVNRAFFADRWDPQPLLAGHVRDFEYEPGAEKDLVDELYRTASLSAYPWWIKIVFRVLKRLGISTVPTDASYGSLMQEAQEWANEEEIN